LALVALDRMTATGDAMADDDLAPDWERRAGSRGRGIALLVEPKLVEKVEPKPRPERARR
jgi:hypothetical protein